MKLGGSTYPAATELDKQYPSESCSTHVRHARLHSHTVVHREAQMVFRQPAPGSAIRRGHQCMLLDIWADPLVMDDDCLDSFSLGERVLVEGVELTEMMILEVSASTTRTLVGGLACLRVHYLCFRGSSFLSNATERVSENCRAEISNQHPQ